MQPGTRLGHFEILEAIGKGGMGEVWRAKDTKLGRDVAIKTLPPEFAQDEERLARFEREAKLLASLNHPNIASIYGLEGHEGSRFFVLEMVEGDTLGDRIKQGPIPVEESLQLALQIADALKAAHESGVIHRDLKPDNIKVSEDGNVKVLDFGLAKALLSAEETEVNVSNSPTLSMAATQAGVILGTAAYMSPEQAKGRAADRRTDVFAFGCVLFEMLTGCQSFGKSDISESLSAVISLQPEWTALPSNLHPRLIETLERCLEKKVSDRYQDIGDVKVEVEKVLADPRGVIVQPDPEDVHAVEKQASPRLPWVASMAAVAVIVGVAVWFIRAPEPPRIVRFDHELAEGLAFRRTGTRFMDISPDGLQVVYNTTRGFYLLSMDQVEGQLIPGTESDRVNVAFSPDGQWLAYLLAGRPGRLQKISISGGAPVPVTEVAGDFVAGLSWGEDDTIVYSDAGTLMRVSADGGTPQAVVGAGPAAFPQMLPGGNAVLFEGQGQIQALPLDATEPRPLFPGSGARYLSTGHIVYALDDALYARAFDVENLEAVGGPVPMLEGVLATNTAHFAVSDSGTLAYISGTAAATAGEGALRSLIWVDREGNEEVVDADLRGYFYPRISPDGNQVALDTRDRENDIDILDLSTGTVRRSTFVSEPDSYPAWDPEGNRIAFFSEPADGVGIYVKNADNTGEAEPILLDDDEGGVFGQPYFFTRDGSALVFRENDHPDTGGNIVMVAVEGGEPQRLLETNADEWNAELSPDGNWMAYQSDESSQNEIYVVPFPEVVGGEWQISTAGGERPLWSPDGQELFYLRRGADGATMMTVPVETGAAFAHRRPQELLNWPYFTGGGTRNYDVSPDGQRFLAISDAPDLETDGVDNDSVPKVNIVINWFEELKERVPVN